MEYAVQKTRQSYVRPSAATPAGSLELSTIDRLVGLRHMVPSLHVFAPGTSSVREEDQLLQNSPACVVREALGKALVDYYPLAGRLADGDGGPGSKRVECTGEGAWFVEAVAGCSLEDVGQLDQYPFAIPEGDLLPDAAPGVEPLDIPLMMQVTGFMCGGFVVGLISSHTITDGLGAGQFINAVGDYARGLPKPLVSPIWARELVPSPPSLLSPSPGPQPRTFQFRPLTVDLSLERLHTIKSHFLQSTGQHCSTFDVAGALTWQARTRVLRLAEADPSACVRICFPANARHLLRGKQDTAAGFYGNCMYTMTASAESGVVGGADVARVVAIIREAKARLPGEFARWSAGKLLEAEDPYELPFGYETLFLSDWRRMGFLEADYGWGTPSHVIPLAYHPFMPIALIGAPPAPRTGSRIMTRCVEEEHMLAFREEMMKAFDK